MYLRTRDGCAEAAAPVTAQDSQVVWNIPAGSLAHAEVVSLGTTIAAIVATFTVLAVVFRDRLKDDPHEKTL